MIAGQDKQVGVRRHAYLNSSPTLPCSDTVSRCPKRCLKASAWAFNCKTTSGSEKPIFPMKST